MVGSTEERLNESECEYYNKLDTCDPQSGQLKFNMQENVCEKRQQLPLTIKVRQVFATICLGAVTLGANLSWTSPVLPQLLNSNSTVSLNTDQLSWVGSFLAVGCLAAAIPAGYLADHFGRKKMILALVIPFIMFCLLAIFAHNVYYLYVGRILAGISAGGVSVISPMYLGEIADPHLRGILGTFFEGLIYLGILICTVVGAYVHYSTLTGILLGIAVMLGACFLFFPESPIYLLKKGAKDRAKEALIYYRGENYDVTTELDLAEKMIEETAKKKINFWGMWKRKATIRGLIACVGITLFQQLSAVDGMVFYCVYVFQIAGTDFDAYTSSVIVSVVQLISCSFVVFIIEKLNRRVYLYMSAAGTGISLFFLGLYFQLKDFGVVFDGCDFIPLMSMVIFFVFFALGLGPIPWLVNSELFPSEVKGPANGITIATNWSMLFIVTKTFPVMLEEFNPKYTFFTFAGCMVLCIFFVKFFIPETRGKSLAQIQRELSR